MKSFLQGIAYQFKGLKFSLRSPKLLLLGLARLVILVMITVAAAVIVLDNYEQILTFMWREPQSAWIAWLWHLISWLLALVLLAVAGLAGFLVAQLFFSVFIMDIMSQITERKISGRVNAAGTAMPWHTYFLYLLRQEIPRTTLPVMVSLLLLVVGWFTPLGPILTVLSPLAASVFLAWDNTDLVPARRLVPFSRRFAFLRRHLAFHLGFGVLFLVPLFNVVLLTFAPVGATLFHVEQIDREDGAAPSDEVR
jgi:CysZ protein